MAMEFDDNRPDPFEVDRTKRPGLLVLLTGIGTSLATLAVLYVLNMVSPKYANVMGWYAYFIIPVGALMVGLAAGSGYGIASRLTGAKIGKTLLAQIVVLQVACYFIAQYVEFRMLIAQVPANFNVSFWEFFDATTRAFSFAHRGQQGPEFGIWGYAIRVLEIGGFAVGGLIVPALLFAAPYCDRCQVYMAKKDLGLLPSGITERKVARHDEQDQKAYSAELQAGLEAGQKCLDDLRATVEVKSPRRFIDLIHSHKERKKEIERQTSRMMVTLERCKQCDVGRVIVKMFVGHDPNQTPAELWRSDLDSEFVRDAMLYHEDRKR